MKGYFTVSKSGSRLYIAGVFVNPGETSDVIEVKNARQIDWLLSKIRSREVSFTPFKIREHKPPTPSKPSIALPMSKECTDIVKPKSRRVSLPANIPSVTSIVAVPGLKEHTIPIEDVRKIIEFIEEPVIETEIVTEIEPVIDAELEPVLEFETTEELSVVEEPSYDEESKRAEYEELKYQQLYAKARANSVEISGRPRKEELIDLLILAKV